MPKVYIPVDAGHDYSQAERFGEIVFIADGNLNPIDTIIMTNLWKQALASSSENDWIVVSSLASHLAIGSAMFASKHGRLNLLIYHHGDYITQTITTP